MNCQQIQEQIADYLDGELDPLRAKAFDAHLQGCKTCRQEVQSLSETLNVLKTLEVPPLTTPLSSGRRGGRYQLLAYAAVLLMGLGLGWSIKPPPMPGHSPVVPSAPVELYHHPPGVHRAWVNAALASSVDQPDVTPFARNTVRLVRALCGGPP
ncbi:MAG: zf-HC2 domain-containing protein [Phycisphaerae bacterium]